MPLSYIQKIWNWKPSPEAGGTVKVRAVKAMAAFLVAMLCFTLISRTADTLTTPIVVIDTPRRTAINHKFSTSGTVGAEGGTAVMAPAGLPVVEMAVAVGDRVAAGDLLFRCDTGDLRNSIAAKQLDIQGLEIELDALAQNDSAAELREQRDLARAQEDHKALEQSANLAIGEAMEKLRAAKRAYERYEDEPPADYDEETLHSLKSAYIAAQQAYDRVVLTEEETLKKSQRAIDDMLDKAVDTTAALRRISLQKAQRDLAELQKNLQAGGAVYAPVDGTITSLKVSTGSRTTADAAALLSDAEDLRLTTKITGDQKKYVQVGDPVDFAPYGEQRTVRGLPILSVTPIATEPDYYLVTISLPEGVTTPGLGGEVKFSQNSGVKDRCIPLSALYMEGIQYYVLVVRETNTILGTEYVAERMDVTVDELGTDTAAVTGPLLQTDKVITRSDKPLVDGDRIRLS